MFHSIEELPYGPSYNLRERLYERGNEPKVPVEVLLSPKSLKSVDTIREQTLGVSRTDVLFAALEMVYESMAYDVSDREELAEFQSILQANDPVSTKIILWATLDERDMLNVVTGRYVNGVLQEIEDPYRVEIACK